MVLPWFAAARFVFGHPVVRAILACFFTFAAIAAPGFFISRARTRLAGLPA
jgi:hypothetical protein